MEHHTQYSASNAWNVNFNNSNVNNNTKSNSNYVRAVSDYRDESCVHPFLISLESIFEAYYDCRKHKRRTDNAYRFEVDYLNNCVDLWEDVASGTYEIGASVCFVVTKPTIREVFAADFRDRVIHHWISKRLTPLFEEYLYPCMMSNRVGKGTKAAVLNVAKDIHDCSNGYKEDCWIYKFDLSGFFMSIDKRLLNSEIQLFIDERYNGDDKETLKWLVEKVVTHCPQNRCFRRCDISKWDGLPKNKSLFGQDNNHGLAIGNLTSQQFANFFLRDMIAFIYSSGFQFVTQYVDDCVIVAKDKDDILRFIPRLRAYLASRGVKLHQKKMYLQHYAKGVSFVGSIIKPHRIYCGKRTVRKGTRKIHYLAKSHSRLSVALSSVNSYFGFTRGSRSYKLRRRWMELLFNAYGHSIYFTNNINSMKIYEALRTV